MLNYYYILFSFIVISIIYGIYLCYKYLAFYFFKVKKTKTVKKDKTNSKINKIKNKFNIKSTEEIKKYINSSDENIDNKLIDNNFNKIIEKIIDLPKYTNIIIFNETNIPQNILKNFDTNKKFVNPIINSFIICKKVFNTLFMNEDKKIINNIDNFNKIYKNLIVNEENYNIILKLYNDDDYKYIIMKNNILLKIINNSELEKILYEIKNNKIFLLKKDKKIFLALGDYYDSEISSSQIKNIFFNSLDLNIEKNNNNYLLMKNFKKIIIIYLVCNEIIYS